MGLRDRLQQEQASAGELQQQAEQRAEQERLRAEEERIAAEKEVELAAQRAEEERMESIRNRIAAFESKKQSIEDEIAGLDTEYAELKSLRDGAREKKAVVTGTVKEFKDVLSGKGIEFTSDLVNDPEYNDEPEVLDYKAAKGEVRKKVVELKKRKAFVKGESEPAHEDEAEEGETGDLKAHTKRARKPTLAETKASLAEEIPEIDAQIQELFYQTPEGQEAKKREFEQKYVGEIKERYAGYRSPRDLFTNSLYSSRLVYEKDLKDAATYGQELVKEILRQTASEIIDARVKEGDIEEKYVEDLKARVYLKIDADWAKEELDAFEEEHKDAYAISEEYENIIAAKKTSQEAEIKLTSREIQLQSDVLEYPISLRYSNLGNSTSGVFYFEYDKVYKQLSVANDIKKTQEETARNVNKAFEDHKKKKPGVLGFGAKALAEKSTELEIEKSTADSALQTTERQISKLTAIHITIEQLNNILKTVLLIPRDESVIGVEMPIKQAIQILKDKMSLVQKLDLAPEKQSVYAEYKHLKDAQDKTLKEFSVKNRGR